MASEHLRRLWREAQARRRRRQGNVKKAHKPPADHPWRRDSTEWFESEDRAERLSPERLFVELGLNR
jgi:hypothetical protein